MKSVVFDLQVPMASWSVGGSSIVPSQTSPTWSAIVGLMGAALGTPRDDELLPKIAQDFGLAFLVIQTGIKRDDYHTIQSPTASKVRNTRVRTRAQELDLDSVDDLNTSITRREYVHDAKYRMFIVQISDSPVITLEQIVAALLDPVYPLCAGRRSCVIGRLQARSASDAELASATHWDQRIPLPKAHSMVAERHDMLVGTRVFGIRHECIQ